MASLKTKKVMDGGLALGVGVLGAVGTSMLINAFMATATPTTRSLVQLAGGGVPLLFFQNRFIRYAGWGAAMAGALGAVERSTGIKTLAGAGGGLTAGEIAMLQNMGALPSMMGPATMSRLNGPATFARGGGVPAGSAGFAAPA